MWKSVKKTFFISTIVWLIICIIAVIIRAGEYTFEESVAVIGMGIFPVLLFNIKKISKKLVKKINKVYNLKKQAEIDKEIDEKMNNLQAGLPVLNIPNLYFGDTQLHYYEPATLIQVENKMLGLLNNTVEISREFYSLETFLLGDDYEQFRTRSAGRSRAVYGDVKNYFSGQLAITNKSILFINQQKGFEIKIDDLSFLKEFSDGLCLQSGNNVYPLTLYGPKYFIAVLNMIRNKNEL